ncbi:MAG TPA: hypothetical protein VF613_20855 [Longimicrobium sp.]|jgi:hypothetical protein
MKPILLLALLALAACADGNAPAANAAREPVRAVAPPTPHSWRANPAASRVALSGDMLTVETGTHAILWDETVPELAPPYEVSATLRKRSGRLHEGTGLLFGGTGLEGPESGQVYTYFLVRGDGSFLVKRRQGAETPVVIDWTRDPAIRRDGEGGGRPNELRVAVGDAEAVFFVNGREVARVPASDLAVRGRAGLRAAHGVHVDVTGFHAGPPRP